jgi:hypothetical protein
MCKSYPVWTADMAMPLNRDGAWAASNLIGDVLAHTDVIAPNNGQETLTLGSL